MPLLKQFHYSTDFPAARVPQPTRFFQNEPREPNSLTYRPESIVRVGDEYTFTSGGNAISTRAQAASVELARAALIRHSPQSPVKYFDPAIISEYTMQCGSLRRKNIRFEDMPVCICLHKRIRLPAPLPYWTRDLLQHTADGSVSRSPTQRVVSSVGVCSSQGIYISSEWSL